MSVVSLRNKKTGYSVSLTFFCGTLTTQPNPKAEYLSLSFKFQLMGAVGLITLQVLLHAFFLSICVVVGKDGQICSPSSCGDIRNISYPFRLKGDPPSCGFPEYELICENNRTMVNLQEYYGGKYYEKYLVTQINYHNYTIRVVDHPGIVKKQNCWISSPLHSIAAFYTSYPYVFPYSYKIVLMKCEESVSEYDYIPIVSCNTTGYPSSSSPTYVYAVFGEYFRLGDIPNSCTVGTYMLIQTLKPLPNYSSNLSMSDLQDYLFQALQLSFLYPFCRRHCEMKGQSCNASYGEFYAFDCYSEKKTREYNKMPTHT